MFADILRKHGLGDELSYELPSNPIFNVPQQLKPEFWNAVKQDVGVKGQIEAGVQEAVATYEPIVKESLDQTHETSYKAGHKTGVNESFLYHQGVSKLEGFLLGASHAGEFKDKHLFFDLEKPSLEPMLRANTQEEIDLNLPDTLKWRPNRSWTADDKKEGKQRSLNQHLETNAAPFYHNESYGVFAVNLDALMDLNQHRKEQRIAESEAIKNSVKDIEQLKDVEPRDIKKLIKFGEVSDRAGKINLPNGLKIKDALALLKPIGTPEPEPRKKEVIDQPTARSIAVLKSATDVKVGGKVEKPDPKRNMVKDADPTSRIDVLKQASGIPTVDFPKAGKPKMIPAREETTYEAKIRAEKEAAEFARQEAEKLKAIVPSARVEAVPTPEKPKPRKKSGPKKADKVPQPPVIHLTIEDKPDEQAQRDKIVAEKAARDSDKLLKKQAKHEAEKIALELASPADRKLYEEAKLKWKNTTKQLGAPRPDLPKPNSKKPVKSVK